MAVLISQVLIWSSSAYLLRETTAGLGDACIAACRVPRAVAVREPRVNAPRFDAPSALAAPAVGDWGSRRCAHGLTAAARGKQCGGGGGVGDREERREWGLRHLGFLLLIYVCLTWALMGQVHKPPPHCLYMDHIFIPRPCLVPKKFCKIFQILRHIESLDVCMKY